MRLDLAVALCKRFEGFSEKPYLCPAGIWTIGYGSTYYESGRRVTQHDPVISKQRAETLLINELMHTYMPGVLRLCPALALDEVKLSAIVDFTYNLGVGRLQTSTLRKKINEQDWEGARAQLKLWTKGGGRVLPGLVLRRDAECALLQ
jgi:lysozyme